MHYPTKVQYTFWDYFRNAYARNRGWRIDHILATPALAKKCVKIAVDVKPREMPEPSDHPFLWAEFKV
jgi:exodeoxyribonuclease-3